MEPMMLYILGIIVCLCLTYGFSFSGIKNGARSRHNHIAMAGLSSLSWTGVFLFAVGYFVFRVAFTPK